MWVKAAGKAQCRWMQAGGRFGFVSNRGGRIWLPRVATGKRSYRGVRSTQSSSAGVSTASACRRIGTSRLVWADTVRGGTGSGLDAKDVAGRLGQEARGERGGVV